MLDVDDLHAYYGKSHILRGVTLRVGKGEIVSLLGRNGAGRSTVVKTIMGQVTPVGSVRFRGARIDGLEPYQIARRGVGYVPEDRDIFPALTVRENLLLGMKSFRPSGRWSFDDVFGLFPVLRDRVDAPGPFAGNPSGPARRRADCEACADHHCARHISDRPKCRHQQRRVR